MPDLNPTGPLPTGWHRVRWIDAVAGEGVSFCADIAAATKLQCALEAASRVTMGSVRLQSWSDYPPAPAS